MHFEDRAQKNNNLIRCQMICMLDLRELSYHILLCAYIGLNKKKVNQDFPTSEFYTDDLV